MTCLINKIINWFAIFFAFAFYSCKVIHPFPKIIGTFCASGDSYSYELALNGDKTFHFLKKYPDIYFECYDKWKFIARDTISLKCIDRGEIESSLSSYMEKREHKVAIIDKSTLKIIRTEYKLCTPNTK